MTEPYTVAVFCASSDRGPKGHRDAAKTFGQDLATNGIRLVFGGGRVGLMGVIADAVMERGGKAIGVIPTHLMEKEVGHSGLSELIEVPNMHERKHRMYELSDAFAILPGGIGTLDETLEILTWKQLRLHAKPIVVVNSDGFWTPLQQLLDHLIRNGYLNEEALNLFHVVDDVSEVLPYLKSQPVPLRTRSEKFI